MPTGGISRADERACCPQPAGKGPRLFCSFICAICACRKKRPAANQKMPRRIPQKKHSRMAHPQRRPCTARPALVARGGCISRAAVFCVLGPSIGQGPPFSPVLGAKRRSEKNGVCVTGLPRGGSPQWHFWWPQTPRPPRCRPPFRPGPPAARGRSSSPSSA